MVEIPGFLKKLGQEVGVQVGIQVVRGFLNEKIKDITPADMYNAIKTNQDLWSVTPEEIKDGGGQLKGRFGGLLNQYQDTISTELIMEWMSKDHPDLYSTVINTTRPSGVKWLNRQVEKIKAKILEEL